MPELPTAGDMLDGDGSKDAPSTDLCEELHSAVQDNQPDQLRQVLLKLVDCASTGVIEAPNSRGNSALHVCAAAGLTECAELLLTFGANPDRPNAAGDRPLHLAAAAAERGAGATRELLRCGADPARQDASGDSALHVACYAECGRIADLLMRAKPSLVNGRNSSGSTGLHISASCENHELLGQLLCHGADFSLADCRGQTPVDLLLQGPDTSGIDCLGRHLMRRLRLFNSGQDTISLVTSREGREFVSQLLLIDGGIGGVANIVEARVDEAEVEEKEETRAQQRLHLSRLEAAASRRRVDAEHLIDVLIAAFQAGLGCNLESSGLLGRIAWQLCQLVLFTEDMGLLKRLVQHRHIWAALSRQLEVAIDKLYAKTLRKQKAGVRELLRQRCCTDGGTSISFARLNKLLAELTAYWQFANRQLVFDFGERRGGDNWCLKRPLRDPAQSLVLWAILSGRPGLAPILLQQEEFDLVPLALLAATLLRSLARRRDIEDVFADRAGRIADICEAMAVKVIKQVKEVDNSPGNCLTISYVSIPLPNYAGYTILDLSARGGAATFIKLDIVELATEKSWYGDFFNFSSAVLRELVIAAGFAPPLMLCLPTLLHWFRGPGTRDFLESVLNDSGPTEHPGNCPEAFRLLATDIQLAGRRRRRHDSGFESGRRRLRQRVSEFCSELELFYNTPCVKFRLHAMASFLFIGLLSYVILHDFQGDASPTEVFCYLTLLGILVEELREMVSARRQETLAVYLTDGWNAIDLVAIACGLLAFAARQLESQHLLVLGGMLSEHGKNWGDVSYVLMVITTLIFWIRILYISVVLESVGVKLKMLSLIIRKDFIPFLYILVVIMVGFGTTFHALLWPNAKFYSQGRMNQIPTTEILLEMFHRTFYTIVGEYGLDELKKECDAPSSTNVSTQLATESVAADKCVGFPGNVLVPYVLMVAYIVIVQVLLLNVIVAMFSKTVDMVDSESKSLWLFERYDLGREFSKRSPLPAPLNLLLEAHNLLTWLLASLHRRFIGRVTRRRSQLNVLAQKTRNFVHLFYLYYQSVTLRRLRARLGSAGRQLEEDELSQEGVALLNRLDELRVALDGRTAERRRPSTEE